jgi:hypothetical protein
MKKGVAEAILSFMIVGLMANGLALWRDSGIMASQVKRVEKKQEKQDTINKELRNKMDDIHWYLIESKGIEVPSKGSR